MPRLAYDNNLPPHTRLTPSEERILELKQQGLKWQEIAEAMGVTSGKSLANRWTAILEKLEVSGPVDK